MTVKDFEIIEDLLEAFGKPRDLVLRLFYPYGIYSYEEYVAETRKPFELYLRRQVAVIAVRIIYYLNAMARQFRKKETLSPSETWELKNTTASSQS